MLKTTVTRCSRALTLGLLLCLFVGETPVWGQETFADSLLHEALQAEISHGRCFGSELSNEKCHLWMVNVQWFDFLTTIKRWLSRSPDDLERGNYQYYPRLSMHQPSGMNRMRRARNGDTALGMQLTIQEQEPDTWPPPIEGGPQQLAKIGGVSEVAGNAPKVEHRTITTTLDLMLPFSVKPRYLITPFAGGGVAHVREKDQREMNYSVRQMTIPVLSYGLSASIHYRNGLLLMVQYKTLVFFPPRLRYIGPDNVRLTDDDVGTVTSSALAFGVGYRF